MTKMTDEELEAFFACMAQSRHDVTCDSRIADVPCNCGAQSRHETGVKLRAHIAAVTAERDALQRQRDNATGHYDDLRERVQTLEEQVADPHPLSWEAARQRVHAAESRLAAIRATARTLQSMSLSAVMADEWSKQASALIREMAGDAGRPAAPPEAYHPSKGLDAGVFDETQQADTTGCCYLLVGGCKAHRRPAPSDPTTPEAFAALKARRHWWAENGAGTPAGNEARQDIADLSLLERRIGAMERAARLVPGCGGAAGFEELRFALTDAPAVFTLKEVQEAVVAVLNGKHGYEQSPSALIRQVLVSLRRTP